LASWSNGAEVNEDGTQKIKVTEDINIVANFTSPFAIAMDTDHKAEAANSEVQNGFEINTYGYCNDNSYRLKYYLLSGEPDQYKVEFDDNRFFDVDWTELATVGPEGTIDLDIPADIPTGDYNMKVTFRNSNYTTFDSEPIEVSFHVNLPETYTVPLYDNVIALVNTCECFTDVQWYHRDNSNADWQAISGATGYYYRQVGGLTGEYFVSAKMNGVSTYTCPQTDVKTLYGAPKKVAKVRVSPNPIENNATVSIEDTENLEHSLRIINVMGNVIEVRTFNGNSTSIDMGAYPTGSYMINVDGIGVKVIRK
ncbi:MAG: T9SS type A sorting domain-containing protein, partial [Clostridia bacterium]|nr:T9SS type A sorting domain-containing protein [Clostridia bacterium]